MLELTTLIGKGNERLCYQHPHMLDKCVKVTFNQKKSRVNESDIEFKYCRRFLKSHTSSHSIPLAFAHELIETNQGTGLLCDLIRDYDGQISKSLDHYRSENQLSQSSIDKALTELLNALVKYAVCITYVHDRNILVQYLNEHEYRFVLIDGFGSTNTIPVGYWSKRFARKQTTRRFLKRYQNLPSTLPNLQ